MKVCNMGYQLQEDGRPPMRCHNYDRPEYCKDCKELDDTYTMEEVRAAIDMLKDWDNYDPFHEQVDTVLFMFDHMEND